MVYSSDNGHHHVGVAWHSHDIILCLLGGLCVGVIASSRMFLFGRVTGISGFVQNAFLYDAKHVAENGFIEHRRISSVLFVIGLIVCHASLYYQLSDVCKLYFVSVDRRECVQPLLSPVLPRLVSGSNSPTGHWRCSSRVRDEERKWMHKWTRRLWPIRTAHSLGSCNRLLYGGSVRFRHGVTDVLVSSFFQE